jgi:transcription initiation factor TFIIH subunit 1
LTTEIEEEDAPHAINATANMMKSIKLRAAHSSPEENSQTNVSTRTKDAAIMAHSTTVDFLHYFWGAFLSGDTTRAEDVRFLYDTLQTSQGRFDTVAELAEKERQSQLDQIHTMEKDMPASKRRRIDKSKLPGGKQAVSEMLMATQQAVSFAEDEYKRTFAQQTAFQSKVSGISQG